MPDASPFEPAALGTARYVLRLYVSGTTPLSARALVNVRQFCEQYLAGRYELDVVDILFAPQLAIDGQIVAVPTLVQHSPLPVRRYIGDMSCMERMSERFGLPSTSRRNGGLG